MGELTLFRKKLLSLDQLKVAPTRDKLDAGVVFLALLVWPTGMSTSVYQLRTRPSNWRSCISGVWHVYSHMLNQRKKVLGK